MDRLDSKVYNAYDCMYDNCSKYDKKISNNKTLSRYPNYTFAQDMVMYFYHYEDFVEQINDYIKKALKTLCRKNKQGYFEMILSTMLMSNIFYQLGRHNESKLCAKWYYDLLYNEDTYKQYVSNEEICGMWDLRNIWYSYELYV